MASRRGGGQRRSPNAVVRIISVLVMFLTLVYGVGITALIGYWLAVGEGNQVVNIFVNTMPIAFLPLPILLALVLLFGKWRFVFFLVAAIAMFGMLYSDIFAPTGRLITPRGQTIELMTYNILFTNDDMESVESLIREQDADIVALQEVSQSQRDYIDANLQDLYPYNARPNRLLGTHYQMILSKYPVQNTGFNNMARAEFEIEGRPLVVYSIQLTSPLNDASNFDDGSRQDDADRIRTLVEGETVPVIIMGDFNMSDATEEYNRFNEEYTDIFRYSSRGFGPTFPNWSANISALGFLPPFIRLDYAFATEGVTPISARVLQEGNSDHYPLVMRVRLD